MFIIQKSYFPIQPCKRVALFPSESVYSQPLSSQISPGRPLVADKEKVNPKRSPIAAKGSKMRAQGLKKEVKMLPQSVRNPNFQC